MYDDMLKRLLMLANVVIVDTKNDVSGSCKLARSGVILDFYSWEAADFCLKIPPLRKLSCLTDERNYSSVEGILVFVGLSLTLHAFGLTVNGYSKNPT